MRAHRVLVALVLASCASSPTAAGSPPPTIPALDLSGAGTARTLGAVAIAEQARQPAALQALLRDAGMDVAAERTWADRTAEVRIVTVRAVRFASPDGARRFAEWLGVHGAELIGGGVADDPLGPMDAQVHHHEPDACCPNKDTTWFLSAWQEGSVVWTVQIGGPGADRAALSDILEEVA